MHAPFLWQETRSWFLAAGYAVAVVDVRGTGASFGQWRAPWQPEERTDSREVIDWIVRQPWSNQQVCFLSLPLSLPRCSRTMGTMIASVCFVRQTRPEPVLCI